VHRQEEGKNPVEWATRRSIWKSASAWGLVGVGIAVFFFLFFIVVNRFTPSPFWSVLDDLGQDIVFFVWPASFWLMATEGAGRLSAIEVVVMAVLANFVLYFLLGLMLTAAWRVWMRVGAKSKNRPLHG
jgi:hypothetical protein